MSRKDTMGALDADCTGENNEDNIRQFFGLGENDELPVIEDGCMLLLENIYYAPIPGTVFSFVRGKSILMNREKYCEYVYYGISGSKSAIPYGYEEVKGYVYGVKDPEDYSGLFFGGAWNSSTNANGGAFALNGVYSKIISGEALTPSLGISVTFYYSLYKEWQYGKAAINWHERKENRILQTKIENTYV